MTTIFTLQGATIMLIGRFSKMTHEQLAARYEAQGATVVSLVGLGLDYMVAGQGYSLQRAQAMNIGIPILDEDDAYRLLVEGQVTRDEIAQEDIQTSFGEVRALLHDAKPDPLVWQALCEQLDRCEDHMRQHVLHYAESFVSQWGESMFGQRGFALPLDDPRHEQLIDGYWAYGMENELRVAPERWVGQMVQGVDSPSFALIRALDLSNSNLSSKVIKTLLETTSLPNLQQLALPIGRAITKALIKTLCATPYAQTLRYLRLGDGHNRLAHWFEVCVDGPLAITTLDTTQYHTSAIPWALAQLDCFEHLTTIAMWDDQLRTYEDQNIPSVPNLHLDSPNLVTLVRVLAQPRFYTQLKQLKLYHYQSVSGWKMLFDLPYQGRLDILDIGSPQPSHHTRMIAYQRANLQRMLMQSVFLERVSTLKLGIFYHAMDVDALSQQFEHLEVIR